MSKKAIIITAVIFILIIGGLFLTAFLITPKEDQTRVDALIDFLPFGGEDGDIDRPLLPIDTTPADPLDEDPFKIGSSGKIIIPKLRQLSSLPIAGATVYTSTDGVIKARYVDQLSGNLYDIGVEDIQKERVTNSTLLGINNVLWGEGGDSLVLQYLDDDSRIKTFNAILVDEGGVIKKLGGVFLEDDIKEITISPDGKRVFYLTDFGNSILGTITTLSTNKKQQIFSHSIKSWLLDWPKGNEITLTTKPSSQISGYSFSLNITTGSLVRLIGNITGLTVNVDYNVERLVYNGLFNTILQTRIYTITNKNSTIFPFTTLSEKCVWSSLDIDSIYCAVPETLPEGSYPDDWYKGLISFTDSIWKLDTVSGAVSLLVSPKEFAGEEIDGIDLFLDENEEYLFFTNKKDSTFWSLKL